MRRSLIGATIPFYCNMLEELENTIANSKNIGTSVVEPMRRERPKNRFLEMVREITGKTGAVRFFDKITSFVFSHEDAQAMHTLFTQEMLGRWFLASKSLYAPHAHTETHVRKYLENGDQVFKMMGEALEKGTVRKLLRRPVAHTGFQKLA